mmetsp:Transcript_2318/g.15402  ORF Transcript_2318/g.15402 Transcript_2318/m.15402 type:complete len:102 (-) Transcript_2318:2156-2461(-)
MGSEDLSPFQCGSANLGGQNRWPLLAKREMIAHVTFLFVPTPFSAGAVGPLEMREPDTNFGLLVHRLELQFMLRPTSRSTSNTSANEDTKAERTISNKASS